MTALTTPTDVEPLSDEANQWRMTLKAEFARAVRLLLEGANVSAIRPVTTVLTAREWRAVLDAARQRVTEE